LTQAAAIGDVDSMKLLIERGAKVDPAASSANPLVAGVTPLTAAAYFGSLAAVRLLLERGARVDAYDGVGGTALVLAAVWEDKPMIAALLQKGADVNRPCSAASPLPVDLGTPLMLAAYAESGKPDVARMLLSAGARFDSVSRNGDTALAR